jgi:DNA double-strand break repair helicase HerA and related ATPase
LFYAATLRQGSRRVNRREWRFLALLFPIQKQTREIVEKMAALETRGQVQGARYKEEVTPARKPQLRQIQLSEINTGKSTLGNQHWQKNVKIVCWPGFQATGFNMTQTDQVFIGGGGQNYAVKQFLKLKYANRHGLVTGATGTGKTVTLQILAENFSAHSVPVFLADVKGDLSGLAKPGTPGFKLHGAFTSRAEKIGFENYGYDAFPVTFWDVFGKQGHPVRTTVAEMGPLLISRLLELTDAQEGVVNIAFRLADEQGLPLLDIKDLQSMLIWLGQNAKDLSLRYGNIATSSIGAIMRRLLVLENQGGAAFFGEPALKLSDLMQVTPGGQGRINILAANKLMAAPRLYATFLLWLLSELFEELPEIGDPDKPKLVFFFDEAHLLFDDAPKALIDKVEQVARLIRSKGVSVFFITQNPADVPEDILGQMGNRIQHALRAFTPRDQRALRAAAETFRPNPAFDTADAIRDVGVGEALVSTLQKKGVPSMVERVLIRPPRSQLGPITVAERKAVLAGSPVAGIYEAAVDRDSAYEALARRATDAATEAAKLEAAEEDQPVATREFNTARRYSGSRVSRSTSKRRGDSVGQAFAKSMARSVGTRAGSALVRGILGGLFKGR